MSLSARAIAVQGVGYSALLLALQGLYPIDELPVIVGGGTWHRPTQPKARLDDDEDILLILSAWLQLNGSQ